MVGPRIIPPSARLALSAPNRAVRTERGRGFGVSPDIIRGWARWDRLRMGHWEAFVSSTAAEEQAAYKE